MLKFLCLAITIVAPSYQAISGPPDNGLLMALERRIKEMTEGFNEDLPYPASPEVCKNTPKEDWESLGCDTYDEAEDYFRDEGSEPEVEVMQTSDDTSSTYCGGAKQVTNVYIGGSVGGGSGGAIYTRWGRTACPDINGTESVYQGLTIGSAYNDAGSSDYLCLPEEPQHLETVFRQQEERGRFYGTEYRGLDNDQETVPAFTQLLNNFVPCSICRSSTRASTITIPGRIECPDSWTREYYGYLMGERYSGKHHSRAPICVDLDAESAGEIGMGTASRSYLYFQESTCTGIKCPPYRNGGELSCVVCTK